jgi:hypothetical protein
MQKRLPEFQSVLAVYAVIAVMFAGWTITAFLWKLSSWLLVLNLREIFTVFSYGMAADFLESLIILLILLAASALLPANLLHDDFVVRGTVLSMGIIGAMMAFLVAQMRFGSEGGLKLLIPPFIVLLGMALVLSRLAIFPWLRSAAIWLSDRLIIFLFILVPLFVVLSGYVIIRNIS